MSLPTVFTNNQQTQVTGTLSQTFPIANVAIQADPNIYDAQAFASSQFTKAQSYALTAFNETLSLISQTIVAANEFDPIVTSMYTDPLLVQLQTWFINSLTTPGIGITPDAEAAELAMEHERDILTKQDAEDKIAAVFSERNFLLPDGILAANISQVEIEYAYKQYDKGRDTLVRNEKLAIQQGQFVAEQSNKLEAILMDYAIKLLDFASREFDSDTQIKIAALGHAAGAAAQVAAGAMASTSAHAQVGYSGNESINTQNSVSQSFNENYSVTASPTNYIP